MWKIWLLTKAQLGNAFDQTLFFKNKNGNVKNKSIFLYITMVFLILILSATSFMYSYGIGTTLKMLNMLELLPELMMAVTCVTTILTTIYKVKGTLFGFKDYDIVMSLPVKTSNIVASRLLLLYLINLAFTLIIMIPADIAYGILAQASPYYYILSLLTLLFIPLVPMIIATIIGTVIAVISAKFKHSNLINIFLTFALLAGVMIGSFSVNSEEQLAEMTATITNKVDNIYLLAKIYRIAVCEYNLIYTGFFLFVSILAFVVFSWIVGLEFKAINTTMTSNRTKANYKIGKLEQTSPFMALYRKEIKRYFSSTLYVMNTAMGIVMLTIGAIATLFFSPESIAQMMDMPGLSKSLENFLPIMVSFCVVMTYVSACSISLEGKNIWILKAAPVSPKEIFNSKIALNLTITLPAIILNSIIIAIGLDFSLIGVLMLVAMPTAFAFFTAVFGLVINLKLPNLNWITEVTVIKQSAASMICSLLGLCIVAVPILLIFLLPSVNSLILNGVFTIVITVITIILYQYLSTNGAKTFTTL